MNQNLRTYKAFTLIELSVIIAIISIVALAGTSTLYNYYRTSTMDFELKTVQARLQRARQMAISNATGEGYSVIFFADRYVIFRGSTFVEGATDNLEHDLSTNVLVSTTFSNDTVRFGKFNGRTGEKGSLTLAAFGLTKVITINELGIVESIK